MNGRLRRTVASAVLAVAAVASTRPARAALDPSTAQAAVEAAMAERQYSFCTAPRRPLSEAARALCPHAAAAPSCQGLADACNDQGERRAKSFLHWLGDALSRLVPGFLKRFFRWLVGGLAALPQVVFLALVALGIAVVAAFVLRGLRRARRDARLGESDEPAEADVALVPEVEGTGEDALLALAEDHVRRGELAAALQLYLAACLRALDRRGALHLGKDRTNGEYVRSCAEEGARQALREIVREVDHVQFGRAPAQAEAVDRAGRLATGIVRAAPLLVLVLALPVLAGCGWKLPHAGDDPAGDELFYEVLERQGAPVGPLHGSLASLPADHDGTRALIVHVEQTLMDAEARQHLVAWVRGGGSLVLVGPPQLWPPGLRPGKSPTFCVPAPSDAHGLYASPYSSEPVTPGPLRGELAIPEAFQLAPAAHADPGDDADDDEDPEVERIAWFDDAGTYASLQYVGDGTVLGIATDELFTNAALARPGNAAVLVAILSHAQRRSFEIAKTEDGTPPPTSPVATLQRAGLGLALGQGLVAALLLFVAAGARLSRPRPAPSPSRRSFVEHVEAVGALYSRTGSASHALAAYVRFVEHRLRSQMPRGTTDVPGYLASRTRLPLEACQDLWKRATAPAAAGAAAPKNQRADGDLMVLKELSAAFAAAIARDR